MAKFPPAPVAKRRHGTCGGAAACAQHGRVFVTGGGRQGARHDPSTSCGDVPAAGPVGGTLDELSLVERCASLDERDQVWPVDRPPLDQTGHAERVKRRRLAASSAVDAAEVFLEAVDDVLMPVHLGGPASLFGVFAQCFDVGELCL
jgi:hypothetical protein